MVNGLNLVGCQFGEGTESPLASNTNTQSPSPSWLLPGGVKSRDPVFDNGDPAMAI